MIFNETRLKGAYVIELEQVDDERGFFARSWCKEEFELHKLNSNLKQCNISFNKNKGTLRGMHFQEVPYEEAKFVRCIRGAIFDVIIDLREYSETFMQWIGVELTADNRKSLYVPEGFAHGFQTLEDNSEVFYQMSEFYYSEFARGIRWNDSAFRINWPITVTNISDKDNNYQFYIVRRDVDL